MELKILGSSSAGNCYILDNGKEALMIECGVQFQEVKKAVDFDISRIVGCIVSHEHGDHAKEIKKLLNARIRVFASMGTIHATGIVPMHEKTKFYPIALKNKEKQNIGNYTVIPFNVKHDAAEAYGFLINHYETGTILFATDCYDLPYKINGLNNILIECNHSISIVEDKLHRGIITEAQSVRTLRNHMSYETCLQTLTDNDLTQVNNIVLIHLSDNNSNARDFKNGIKEATGKTVHVADKGMVLNFNKFPF